ncbi:hypothetical protein CICLE_v10026834mg [Citrus x clementina]|uniref:Uncharacterized protein n=1 Tax=Citrus clementina TaxID=85681 RepID=V4SR56_CITCL|nr:hypothetical protein CICLE_v10026834mg [Citrus x clementina]
MVNHFNLFSKIYKRCSDQKGSSISIFFIFCLSHLRPKKIQIFLKLATSYHSKFKPKGIVKRIYIIGSEKDHDLSIKRNQKDYQLLEIFTCKRFITPYF